MPTLIFSHANGFPAGTYRQLFERWRATGWDVRAIDRIGHDPEYPVSTNWTELLRQVLTFVDANDGGEGVWLVGHSLGGLLSLMASCERPGRVHGVVMIDSPLIVGWRSSALKIARHTKLLHRFSPGRIAERRRDRWPDPDAAHAHFVAKPKFARWAPGVLKDYLDAGLTVKDGEAALAFERAIEARIYDTLPHTLGHMLRSKPPRCPVGLIAGTESEEVRQGGLSNSITFAGDRFRWIDGSHLFPMERPEETALTVLELLATMPRPGRAEPSVPAAATAGGGGSGPDACDGDGCGGGDGGD